ncbi:polyribonucleotide nucleotidyltransferase 1, mitochondrial [Phlebotomus argentipes]|uniref:polyribonucleotide nucleotidyltransferase 1, mitochondrial n=1 Tax=Phlebotomus argentipes TaxID=94469 RepID=UPI002893002D|nr:polyribonucleotide nucleotidyltransferase 1, mitochondrial [Phlebotomus argentipes]
MLKLGQRTRSSVNPWKSCLIGNLFHRKVRKCKHSRRCFNTKAEEVTVEAVFSNNRTLSLTTGKYARFANGSVLAEMGDTAVMVTAVAKQKPSSGGFVPLIVDYRQKSAAAGRIPTNFLRREMGPSEKEILSARLIDRSVRPLFSPNFRYETQIVCNLLAVDHVNLPDVCAVNAASAALSVSDIPWNGPVAAVRMGLCDNEIIVNPTRRELQASSLDLVVSATKQNLVVMLEGKGDIVLLNDIQKAIKQGTREAQHVINCIEKLQKTHGRPKRTLDSPPEVSDDIVQAIRLACEIKLREIFRDETHDKISRDTAVNVLRENVLESVRSDFPDADVHQIEGTFSKYCREVFRELIFERNLRCDGRGLDDLRNISCKIDLHKPLHGSALFQRGQTQVFCTVALDSQESAMKLDTLAALDSGSKAKNFFLHYEFPPYATGEIGRLGPIGRREMGHGALAEKGLLPTLPSDFPFTVRLTSEVLESNGSSSMASVCGGSLALMDAGVPVSAPAAGVAIGLVTKYQQDDTKHLEDYRLLTDLLGIEDYMGDMDMKVAGTRKGVTAVQVDLKIPGLPLKVMMEALQKATDAKGKILDIMKLTLSEARRVKKDSWPVSDKITIEPHQRSKLIGPGGVNIRKIYLQTGAQLSAETETSFTLFAPSLAAMDEAREVIEEFLKADKVPDLEFGGIYTAKIVDVKDIGVMVTLYPSMPPALLHNSQLDQRKIAHPSVLGLEVGQEIQVKYFGRDPVSGYMRLSRKVLQGPSTTVRNLDRSEQSDV